MENTQSVGGSWAEQTKGKLFPLEKDSEWDDNVFGYQWNATETYLLPAFQLTFQRPMFLLKHDAF